MLHAEWLIGLLLTAAAGVAGLLFLSSQKGKKPRPPKLDTKTTDDLAQKMVDDRAKTDMAEVKEAMDSSDPVDALAKIGNSRRRRRKR